MGEVKFNSLGIELSVEERDALREVVRWAHLYYNAKPEGVDFPDDFDFKEIFGLDNANLKFVSDKSPKRKFNIMPLNDVKTLVIIGIKNSDKIGVGHSVVLLELCKKIQDKLKGT